MDKEELIRNRCTRFFPVKCEIPITEENDGIPIPDLYEIKDRISFNKLMLSGETLKGTKEGIVDVCNALNGKYAYKINYNLEWVDNKENKDE